MKLSLPRFQIALILPRLPKFRLPRLPQLIRAVPNTDRRSGSLSFPELSPRIYMWLNLYFPILLSLLRILCVICFLVRI